jgi:lauroyl/myristoyl acyltransferase
MNICLNLLLSPIYLAFWCIGFVLTFLPIFPSRVGLENLKQRLALGYLKRHLVMSRVYLNYILYFLEITLFQIIGCVQYSNENAFYEFMSSLKTELPPTVLGAHLGNIEAGGQVTARAIQNVFRKDFFVLAAPAPHPILTWFEQRIRSMHGLQVIQNNRPDLARCLLKTMKEGNSLGLLIDQKPSSGGPFFPFFGTPAAFPAAGVTLATRTRPEFIFVATRRIWPGRFEILFEKLASPENIMEQYVSILEKNIRKSPSQWFWDYKKWSRKP